MNSNAPTPNIVENMYPTVKLTSWPPSSFEPNHLTLCGKYRKYSDPTRNRMMTPMLPKSNDEGAIRPLNRRTKFASINIKLTPTKPVAINFIAFNFPISPYAHKLLKTYLSTKFLRLNTPTQQQVRIPAIKQNWILA